MQEVFRRAFGELLEPTFLHFTTFAPPAPEPAPTGLPTPRTSTTLVG
jgi:hypothetical protein